MKGLTYRLHKRPGQVLQDSSSPVNRYTEDELTELTTFQLQQICQKEKLVAGLAHTLDREGLVRTILKYRNAEERRLIRENREGGFERVQAALQSYLNSLLADQGQLSGPAKLVLWNGLKVGRRDRYRISGASMLGESNVLLVSEDLELCGIFNLVKERTAGNEGRFCLESEGRQWRPTSNRHYSLLFFPQGRFRLSVPDLLRGPAAAAGKSSLLQAAGCRARNSRAGGNGGCAGDRFWNIGNNSRRLSEP